MSENKKSIPKSYNLRTFFGAYFDIILRHGSERSEELVELVKERRGLQQCDVCGMPMKTAPDSPKPFVGAYLCDYCRRELQSK